MADPSTNSGLWASEVRTRLSALHLSPTRENEIVEELSQHLEDRWRELTEGGAPPDEAARTALSEFRDGNMLAKYMAPLRQAHTPTPITPGARTGHLLTDLLHSLRYATRILWKQPSFSAVAVLTLALGIGASTAIFSVVYGVLLKPLPFPDANRLVALYHLAPGFGPGPKGPQGAATYFTYRDDGRVFEDIGLWNDESFAVIRGGEPEQVHALRVTDGTLSLLGVRPALGRLIRKEDDVPGAPLRVLLTHAYWQRAFGSAPDVVGQSLTINARPYEIIGVLPASFKLLNTKPQVILPLRLNRATTQTGGLNYNGIARLKPQVTVSQANDDIARMIPSLVDRFPLMPGVTREMWDGVGLAPNVRPLSDEVIGEMRRPLWILMGTVGLVLLMAWTNVANLLLVRAEGRQRELAVRRALGANRGRIVSELLSECLVLGLAGGTAGIIFAEVCIALLRRTAPAALPRVEDIGIDWVVLLVTLTTSVVTSLVFGLVPVLKTRLLSFEVLKESGRSTTDTPGRHRTRSTLVVTQVAFAMLLLVVSGLMARTFVAMRHVAPGFVRPAEVQTFSIALPAPLIRDRQQVPLTYEEIAERLKAVPGVSAVGLANMLPMDGSMGGGPIFVEDRPIPGTPPARRVKAMGPGYLETMGTTLVAGRAITWADIHQPTPIVWVSENFAREFWSEPSKALGKRIGGIPGEWEEIVGVIGNVREEGLNQPVSPLIYQPMADQRFAYRDMSYVVRSDRVGTPGFLRELQQAVRAVTPNVPLADAKTLDEIQAESMSQTSFAMVMLAVASGVALLLALVGVYGVVSYIATARTQEVGIRMALGAQTHDVLGLFLRHGLALTVTGIVLGVGAAVLLTPIMSTLLYGVRPTDPVTYTGVAIALAAVTLLATYVPARRASLVSPLIALRSRE